MGDSRLTVPATEPLAEGELAWPGLHCSVQQATDAVHFQLMLERIQAEEWP